MGKVNFTTERVNSFQCEPGKKQSIFWDAKIPGLGLRVTSAGARSYIFESRLHGKTVRTTIGDPRTWTISQAQAEATSLKSLTDKGIDPREQKAELRVKAEAARAERKRRNVTLGEAWPIYLEARQKKWSSSHYQAHVSVASSGGEQRRRGQGVTTAGPLASLMPLPLSELTSDRIGQWLAHESAQRPTFASLSFRLLRAFASWASDMPAYADLIPENAFSSRRVRDALPKYAAKEGDALQREQLPAWFNAVRNIPNAVISAYLQGLLITGARREELAQLRWEDVDFQWRSLTIRDKVEGARVIPLPTYLSTLISNLPRRNEWVFSSPTAANGRLTEPRIAHTKALAAAGLPHISLHGLRRSFGTLCEWVEMPSGVSAQIMGHKPSALAEKHYRRRPLDLLRMWHDKIEAWMLEQAGIGNSEE